MSYPVTSQPQSASTCYQTQLSDWHTGLTDGCNDMPVCECPVAPSPDPGRSGRGRRVTLSLTLLALLNPLPGPFRGP